MSKTAAVKPNSRLARGGLRVPSPAVRCVLGGALLGAACFLLVYGFAPLDVTNDAWLRGGYVERDTLQHYTGWLFYREAPWGFPLAVAQNIAPPSGTYIGLSDSIPLFAVLLKLLSPVLPATFQYFGLWCFLCSTLQGAAAAALLGLFSNSRLRVLLGSLVFIFAPILLDRQLRHCALGAQWLILLALYCYFKNRRQRRFFSPGLAVLCTLSILIHPYFTPMVFAILFALLVENAILLKKWWQPLASLGLCLAATLLAGWVFGAFHGGVGGGGTTYGHFSMNLNALFNPKSYGGAGWSLFFPVQNQLAGQYDGFNYLGLGLLLAWAGMAAEFIVYFPDLFPRLRRLLKARFALLFVCLCLGVFAVSNVVAAQGRVLFILPLPTALAQLAGQLRSSGRLFWPVWYLLALAPCVFLMRRPKGRLPGLLLGVMVAVQLVDLSPALTARGASFRPYHPVQAADESPLQSGFWPAAAGAYAHLESLDGDALAYSLDLAAYAAGAHMTTNDPFTARYDVPLHRQQATTAAEALAAGTFATDTLYLTSDEATFLALAGKVDTGAVFCAAADGHWFVFAPYNDIFSGYQDDDAIPFDAYPLLLPDYNDALWEGGVLRSDPATVCFYDTPFARQKLEGMRALRTEAGGWYPIKNISYKDEGWLLVTLGTEDAAPLRGQPLEGMP